MKKFIKKLKNNKILTLLLILGILAVIFLVKLVIIFTESDEKVIYGERLKGEDRVTINAKDYSKKLSNKIGEQVEKVSVRTQGRIINIEMIIKEEISRDQAKDLANQSIGEFNNKEKAYYDFQVFINKSKETEDKAQFPIIGYKHHTKDSIVWTKDR